MIKKLLLLPVGLFILFGSLLWIFDRGEAAGESEPIVASTGITITVTTLEPIDEDVLLRAKAIQWMIQARDSHQDLVDNPSRREYWHLTLEGQMEWVRRYDVVIDLLEK